MKCGKMKDFVQLEVCLDFSIEFIPVMTWYTTGRAAIWVILYEDCSMKVTVKLEITRFTYVYLWSHCEGIYSAKKQYILH